MYGLMHTVKTLANLLKLCCKQNTEYHCTYVYTYTVINTQTYHLLVSNKFKDQHNILIHFPTKPHIFTLHILTSYCILYYNIHTVYYPDNFV